MSNAQPDPKCKTCAYRVFESRWETSIAKLTMVCLQPQIGRQDCATARHSAAAKCGPDAVLWKARAAIDKATPQPATESPT